MHETAPSVLYNDNFARLVYYFFVTAINLYFPPLEGKQQYLVIFRGKLLHTII